MIFWKSPNGPIVKDTIFIFQTAVEKGSCTLLMGNLGQSKNVSKSLTKMRNKLLKILPFIGIFTLGLYTSSQFIFNKPVEPHRWLLTTLVTVFFLALADEKND